MSYIISELDEIEKEEFFRLKKVLKVKDKKRLEEEAEEKATMEAMLEVSHSHANMQLLYLLRKVCRILSLFLQAGRWCKLSLRHNLALAFVNRRLFPALRRPPFLKPLVNSGMCTLQYMQAEAAANPALAAVLAERAAHDAGGSSKAPDAAEAALHGAVGGAGSSSTANPFEEGDDLVV